MITYIIYLLFLIVLVEVIAYLWHKELAHQSELLVKDNHLIHHQDVTDQAADNDFIFLLGIFYIGELLLTYMALYGYISYQFTVFTIMVTLSVLIINWYIHKEYHNETSWLKRYGWFNELKNEHMIHHTYPNKNYGIITHFADKLLGTYTEPVGSSVEI